MFYIMTFYSSGDYDASAGWGMFAVVYLVALCVTTLVKVGKRDRKNFERRITDLEAQIKKETE